MQKSESNLLDSENLLLLKHGGIANKGRLRVL